MFEKLKPLVPYMLGGLGLSLLSFVVWVYTNNDRMVSYFGGVTSVEVGEIVIVDRDRRERFFEVSPEATVFRKHEALEFSNIQIGDFVQVSGEKKNSGELVVSAIRVLRPPRLER